MTDKVTVNLRAASSVLVTRKTPKKCKLFPFKVHNNSNFQLLMVKRKGSARFFAGAHVFPGGVVEKGDLSPYWNRNVKKSIHNIEMQVDKFTKVSNNDSKIIDRSHPLAHHQHPIPEIAFRVCGVREVFEESNILLATKKINEISNQTLLSWRSQVNSNPNNFTKMAEDLNLDFQFDSLIPFSQWITPTREKYRYNTMFYLSVLSEDDEQEAQTDKQETVSFDWWTPKEALTLYRRGDVYLAPPTWFILNELSQFQELSQVIEYSKNKKVIPFLPFLLHPSEIKDEIFEQDVVRVVALPGDRLHDSSVNSDQKKIGNKNRLIIRMYTDPETKKSTADYTWENGVGSSL